MKRILLLVTVALVMAAMLAVNASAAFALPPNLVHGAQVYLAATAPPPSPILGPLHGEQVSLVAKFIPTDPCADPVGTVCPI